MSVAGAVSGVPSGLRRGAGVLRELRTRPQAVAEIGAVGAWAILVAHEVAIAAGWHHHNASSLADGLALWAPMSAAMMLPAAIPAARHVGVNSLRWRRHRAVAEYVAAFLAVWIGYGVAALTLVGWWRPPLVVVLALAAAWQFAPGQRRSLRSCHRTVPLPPTGWRATRGAVRFGVRNAAACVGSCWALMLVMAVVTSDHLAWTAVLAFIVAAEKLLPKPRRTSRVAGAALAVVVGVALLKSALVAAPASLLLMVSVGLVVLESPHARHATA